MTNKQAIKWLERLKWHLENYEDTLVKLTCHDSDSDSDGWHPDYMEWHEDEISKAITRIMQEIEDLKEKT